MGNDVNEKQFRHIDSAFEYVKEGIKEGKLVPEEVRKIALVQARQGVVGEKLETILPSGLKETKGIVELDETTGQPGWIARNPGGEEYIIKDSDFHKMYMDVPETPGVYKKKTYSLAVQIDEDISFVNKYGEEFKMEKGGHLIFFDEARGVLGNRTYGVAGEVWDTYERTGRTPEEALAQSLELLEITRDEVKPELTPEQAADHDVKKASENFDKQVETDLNKRQPKGVDSRGE